MSKVNLGAGAPKKGRRRAQSNIQAPKFEPKKGPSGFLWEEGVKVYRGGGMVKKRK